MYKTHELLPDITNPKQKLWRYLKYNRLLQIINDNSLYFPHISEMKDKWEGLLSEKTKNIILKSYQNISIEEYEGHRNFFYINSWHMNDYESYLMWKVYGDRECAIQTTHERLINSFGEVPPIIHGCIITYKDYEHDTIPVGNTFFSVSYKDLPYIDEKEIRLFYWQLAKLNQSFTVNPKGVKVKIDVNNLIENIYINPTEKIDIESLKKLISGNNLQCKIINSRIREK